MNKSEYVVLLSYLDSKKPHPVLRENAIRLRIIIDKSLEFLLHQ